MPRQSSRMFIQSDQLVLLRWHYYVLTQKNSGYLWRYFKD